jgi:hypothetical protein
MHRLSHTVSVLPSFLERFMRKDMRMSGMIDMEVHKSIPQ